MASTVLLLEAPAVHTPTANVDTHDGRASLACVHTLSYTLTHIALYRVQDNCHNQVLDINNQKTSLDHVQQCRFLRAVLQPTTHEIATVTVTATMIVDWSRRGGRINRDH